MARVCVVSHVQYISVIGCIYIYIKRMFSFVLVGVIFVGDLAGMSLKTCIILEIKPASCLTNTINQS